jgi:NDP-sugar pyrophosphorylase family protein
MKVVLFATRVAPELYPLTNEFNCVAALQVGGKPLVVHTIESLAMAGLKAAKLVISPSANELRERLGDGARWGMRFDYCAAHGSESPDDVLCRLRAESDDDFLVVRGEILRTPIIEEFLARIRLVEEPTVAATIAGVSAGVRYVRNFAGDPLELPDDPANPRTWRENVPALDFPFAAISLIESLSAFHQANLKTIAGFFPGLIVPGRRSMPGVIVGRGTRLRSQAIKGQSIFVGSQCHVAANAELMSDVVVCDNVVIDRRATLRSAVIMPNSYVGQLVEVSDAVVDGDTLIHIDTGFVTQVPDSFLLTNVRAYSIGTIVREIAINVRAMLANLQPVKWLGRALWSSSETADSMDFVNSSGGERLVSVDQSAEEPFENDMEGNHIGGRNGHETVPRDARGLQAARTYLRQTYDLLSARGSDDGRDP